MPSEHSPFRPNDNASTRAPSSLEARPLPIVEHAEVLLRDLEFSDIASWFEYLALPQTLEHTSWNIRDADELHTLIARVHSRETDAPIRFAITTSQTQQLIGTIGFPLVSTNSRSAEIAYDLHPKFWGQGIASACCAAVTAWGFAVMRWRRIQAVALDTNLASQRVLEKCGFEREGKLRHYRLVRGIPRDFYMYALLSDC